MGETRLLPWTPAQERIASVVIRLMTVANVWVFRMTGGRLGARFRGGAPICLVTTRGRRSGARRTVALLYLRDGERVVIVGSDARARGGTRRASRALAASRRDVPRLRRLSGADHARDPGRRLRARLTGRRSFAARI
jgi:hypothetical protein